MKGMIKIRIGYQTGLLKKCLRPVAFKKKSKYIPYFFIAPNMILFFSFMIIPLLYTFYIGFYKWDVLSSPTFIGLKNYLDLFKDKLFWKSLVNTAYYTLATVPIIMAIALFMAILLNKPIKFRTLFRGALYIPSVISSVVIGMLWTWIFNADYGILNYFLNVFGINSVNWMNNPDTAMIPIIITTLWTRVGYNLVIYLAGLQNIPAMYYEACAIDGASKWQQFIYITFPLLKTTNFFILIMAIIYGFRSFDLIYVMTRGGPAGATTTMVLYIYQLAFQFGRMGKACALSIALFIIIAVLTIFQLKLEGGKE